MLILLAGDDQVAPDVPVTLKPRAERSKQPLVQPIGQPGFPDPEVHGNLVVRPSTSAKTTCPELGQENNPDQVMCTNCGTSLSPKEEDIEVEGDESQEDQVTSLNIKETSP
jgi:Zn ribbon nucleic-acid-binding protein